MRARRPWIARLLLLTAMAVAAPGPAPAQAGIAEHQIKAAFLYNFVKFVTWPAESFRSPEDPMTLCVAGHDALRDYLAQLAAGKSVNNRRVQVLDVTQPADARACHLMFIGAQQNRPRDYLAATQGAPVLTVGETDSFASWGGIITFVVDRDRVRFEINLDVAEGAGLKISSKLLSLARAVNVGKGGP